ncbi:MAG: hypothetical protein OHK0046_30550 [Anaerolineae bacterium]
MRFAKLLLFVIFSLSFSVFAQEDAETTPEVTPEATAFVTDYTIPPDPEGLDTSQVVAQVGDTEITLGEFRDRARYERFYYYYFIEGLAEQFGETALNLQDPNNQVGGFIGSLLGTLVVEDEFGTPLYETVLLETLYRQEAEARGLTPDECAINEQWARQLRLAESLPTCEVPEGFEQARADFLERVEAFTNFTEEDVTRILTSRAQFDLVVEALQEETVIEDVENVRTRHIRVADEAAANEVIARLEAGEDFLTLLGEYTLDENPLGNGGDLGTFGQGQSGQAPELESAMFAAEVGLGGPVQSSTGWHIFEVQEKATEPTVRARHLLLETEDEANAAIRILEDDPDAFPELAQRYSLDTGSRMTGGELPAFTRGMMVAPFEEAAFAAEVNEIVGPVETQFGYHVIQVLEQGEQASTVTGRHILVETEEEAQAALERIQAGEDFAAVAAEVSLDPAAQGHRGDTRRVLLGATESGFYTANDVFTDLADAVFSAEAGAVVGPVASPLGDYFVVEVQELTLLPPDETTQNSLRNQAVVTWQQDQLASDRVMRTQLWRGSLPNDLLPSDVSETLAPLDEELAFARTSYEAFLEENSIVNILRILEAPEIAAPAPEVTPEITPEAEATEESN